MTLPETAGPQTSTDGGYTLIEHLPFTTAKVIGARARIGLVVLASDYTIEHEFRRRHRRSIGVRQRKS